MVETEQVTEHWSLEDRVECLEKLVSILGEEVFGEADWRREIEEVAISLNHELINRAENAVIAKTNAAYGFGQATQ